jgi:hypothetical protein
MLRLEKPGLQDPEANIDLNCGLPWLDFPLLQVVLALAEPDHHLPFNYHIFVICLDLGEATSCSSDTSGNIKAILRTLFFQHPTRHHPSLSTHHNTGVKPRLAITVACHSDQPTDQMPTLATKA